jgi:dTDP-4-dehydrorhamnose reductase
MNIWVFGGTGVLGQHVMRVAMERGHSELYAPNHQTCPIEHARALGRLFASDIPKPDVLINCAGSVSAATSFRQRMLTNSIGPWNLAATGVRLVHMSTDCVFSGRELRNDRYQAPLDHNNHADPVDIYGRSKLLGEPVGYSHVTVVRGSFIDPAGGFLNWLINAKGRVDAWMRANWNGTSARHMAEHLVDLAEHPPEQAIVHVAAAAPVTKAWMVEWFVEQLGLDDITSVHLVNDPQIWRVLEPDIETIPVVEMCNELVEEIQRDH